MYPSGTLISVKKNWVLSNLVTFYQQFHADQYSCEKKI